MDFAFSPDGKYLVGALEEEGLVFLSVRGLKEVSRHDVSHNPIKSVGFTADGIRVIAVDQMRSAHVLEPKKE